MENLSSFLEFFGWLHMTGIEKTEFLRNFSIAFTAAIGLVFLMWRAISQDTLARAAIGQSKVAIGQLGVANKNVELQSKQLEATASQIEILTRQAELAAKTAEETLENNLLAQFNDSMSVLSNAKSDMERVIAIAMVTEVSTRDERFLLPALNAFQHYARTISPALSLDMKLHSVFPGLKGKDIEQELNFLRSYPLAFWIDLKPSMSHVNPYEFLQNLDSDNLSDGDINFIEGLWSMIGKMHASRFERFWYGKECKPEIQAILDAIERLKRSSRDWPVPMMGVKLDGGEMSAGNFSHMAVSSSTLRGSFCYDTDFSHLTAIGTDFSSSMLTKCDFTGANLTFCDFHGCDLSEAKFENAVIRGSRFTNCLGITDSMFEDSVSRELAIFD